MGLKQSIITASMKNNFALNNCLINSYPFFMDQYRRSIFVSYGRNCYTCVAFTRRYEPREQTEPQQSKANLWQVTKQKRAGGRGK
jgi:hypothetical protein